MPWLVQHGPRSLNFVSKKSETKKILHENLLLKEKIEKARSSVRREDILMHQEKVSPNFLNESHRFSNLSLL